MLARSPCSSHMSRHFPDERAATPFPPLHPPPRAGTPPPPCSPTPCRHSGFAHHRHRSTRSSGKSGLTTVLQVPVRFARVFRDLRSSPPEAHNGRRGPALPAHFVRSLDSSPPGEGGPGRTRDVTDF